jgi:uncharacterized protein (DUF1330 family)
MAAYAISEVEILDPDQTRRYQELAAASIAHYGGRYLVRGARPRVPEGGRPIEERVVLVEFPSEPGGLGDAGAEGEADAL